MPSIKLLGIAADTADNPIPVATHKAAEIEEKLSRGREIGAEVGKNFAEDFHIYAVEWEPTEVRFYVDQTQFATFTPQSPINVPGSNVPPTPSEIAGSWVFDHPYFLLLNVAVGGDWPGPPDATSVYPQTMLVDYVRVYTSNHS